MPAMKLLVVVLALFALPAGAQTVFSPTWSWTAPTTCSDGSPIAKCPVTKYTLYTGLKGTTPTVWGVIAANLTSVATPNTPAGTWCGQITASDSGGESAPSTPLACITLSATSIPTPPGGAAVAYVTTSTIVYGLAPAHDQLAFLIVGSVPLGTACLPGQTANLYRVVPVASVTFSAPYKSTTVPTVFALCSG